MLENEKHKSFTKIIILSRNMKTNKVSLVATNGNVLIIKSNVHTCVVLASGLPLKNNLDAHKTTVKANKT